jgi:hypothetical protein
MRWIEGGSNDEFDATIFQGFRNVLELERSYWCRSVNHVRSQSTVQWLTRAF